MSAYSLPCSWEERGEGVMEWTRPSPLVPETRFWLWHRRKGADED